MARPSMIAVDVDPLIRRVDPERVLSTMERARKLGVHSKSLDRWTTRGTIQLEAADRVAVGLGLHPSALWPEWFDLPIRESLLEPRGRVA